MSHQTYNLSDTENPELSDELIGQTFGVYRIMREIGRGGMGVVYLAERIDGAFRQDVAIKFVKRGMDTDSILKRFRNERQILAALSHSNVALLYDGGTTDRGLPYFVMEYVAGESLYQFCDSRKLSIKERLKIFIQVCEAVHAAHQIKVVHRDLKPSNILVKSDGIPKLLDFGIAKLLDTELADSTIDPTATQMRMMTPEYASPEQVSGGEITPASDIYSLGVLLYELLSGHRPYRLKDRSPLEIARVICERSPESLSDSLESEQNFLEKSEDQTLEQVLKSRGSNLEELRRELSGDLEKVVMNALQKKPDNRYQTALELAEDIQLYLKGKPIRKQLTVLPESRIIPNTRKISLAVLPLKVIGAGQHENTGDEYLSIGLADALITRLSNVERLIIRSTSSVTQFHNQKISPVAAGQSLRVDYVVDGNIRRSGEMIRVSLQLLKVADETTLWAKSFDEKFTDVLELEDSISEQVTRALVPHLTTTEKARLSRRETNNPEAYQAYLRGRYFWNQFTPDTFPKALESFEKAIEFDPEYALAYVGIADFYNWASIFGLYPPGEGYEKTKEAALHALKLDEGLSEAYAVLGFITAFYDCEWEEGERLIKKALKLPPNYGLAHEWYSALLAGTGRTDEALKEIMLSLEIDALSLRTLTLAAWTLYQLRKFPEALAKVEEIFEMHPNYYQGFFQRSNVFSEIGRAEEAVVDARKGMMMASDLGYMNYKLCFALVRLNRYEEARELVREFEKAIRSPEIDSYHLGMCYAALGEDDLAFEWFNKAVEKGHSWNVWLATDIKLDRLRGDARFDELLRKTNRSYLIKKKTEPKLADEPQNTKLTKSIAVLPLQFIGEPESEDEYLTIGLADAIITRLSGLRRLVVRPTSSVLRFRQENADVFQAGHELNVEYIVEGTVRRIGERVRVSTQLLSVKDNSTVWAEKFDEKYTDVLELEDSISENVVRSIIPQLSGEEERQLYKRGTNNPNAYDAYLRGRYFANQFSGESLLKSVEAYQEAIRFDPNYALPYVGLADFYIWSAVFGAIPCQEAYLKAKTAVENALRFDNMLGEAYAISAFITLLYEWNWTEAERLIRRALELNPNNPFAHECYSNFYSTQGKFKEAIREIKLAEDLDPLSPRAKLMTAWTFYQAGHFPESVAKAEQANKMQTNFAQGFLHLGNAQIHNGEIKQAIESLQRSIQLWSGNLLSKYMLCFAFAADGQMEKAREVLNEILKIAAADYVKPYFVAVSYVALGEIDLAFEWFEKSVEQHDDWMIWFATDIKLNKIRKDHRYSEILRKINNPIISR